MPAKRLAYALLPLLLTLFACSSQPDPLVGTWTAVDVRQNGDSMRLSPQQVGFVFSPNGRYEYRATLRYTEAGTYHRKGEFLIAKDTTRANSSDRIVAIDRLTADSLVLRMQEGEAERSLILLKNQ